MRLLLPLLVLTLAQTAFAVDVATVNGKKLTDKDVQAALTGMTPGQREGLLRDQSARKQVVPVIYLKDEFSRFQFIGNFARDDAALRYEPGSAFDPRVDSTAGVYFTKECEDGFSNSYFASQLNTIQAGRLVIAGVYANRSVLETAKTAIARGYGYAAATVQTLEDLAPVRSWLAGPRDRPMLIDAKVTRTRPSWWLEEAFRGH